MMIERVRNVGKQTPICFFFITSIEMFPEQLRLAILEPDLDILCVKSCIRVIVKSFTTSGCISSNYFLIVEHEEFNYKKIIASNLICNYFFHEK